MSSANPIPNRSEKIGKNRWSTSMCRTVEDDPSAGPSGSPGVSDRLHVGEKDAAEGESAEHVQGGDPSVP
ncbi:hypothetical protein GCM10010109_66300 [Actinoplanes campanulatus]|nr:hypothetical protein GCM10010109_66300 [Actinoplanes campanulatus]GID40279.1 hypothetical protein Aca09nite_67850 [Actinoplanes campanulatus]